VCKKTERVRRMEEEVSVQEDRERERGGWMERGVCKIREREEDGGRGECARRQGERRMDEEVSVKEDRESEEDGGRGECARRQRE
jgi:hypothetical protein